MNLEYFFIDLECQIRLIKIFGIWLIPFILNISVPAKAMEFYLDLRRRTDELVLVCARFSYVILLLHIIVWLFFCPSFVWTSNSSCFIIELFRTICREASSWFASRRATYFYSCSRSTRDPNSLWLDGEASNPLLFFSLFFSLFKIGSSSRNQ